MQCGSTAFTLNFRICISQDLFLAIQLFLLFLIAYKQHFYYCYFAFNNILSALKI